MTSAGPPELPGRPPGEPGRRARRVATSRAERRKGGPLGALTRGRGGRRKAPQPRKVVLRVIVATLLGLGLITGVGVVLVYNNWNGNLDHEDVSAQLKNRPEKETKALNILVMGSDTRDGKGNRIDGEAGGGLSDTTILFHVSANREFAYGISIPRDTAVTRPTCFGKDDSEIAGGNDKWNAAFAKGGQACTIQQLEQVTGVYIDNYVVVDFNGFKDMVNALDGVEVCIPEDIDDDTGNIHLKAGTRQIKGDEALGYVRVRYSVGNGTDTDRTRRQQAFIGSMINKVFTAGIIARPDRLIRFMNAATDSLKTDYDDIADMADLAFKARGIGPDNIKFVTTPFTFGSDRVAGGIEWTPEVKKLWRLVRQDKPLTPEFLKDAISADDSPDGTPSGSESPDGDPTDGSSPTDKSTDGTGEPQGLDSDSRAEVGLC